jgi:hypothetical protein
MVVRISGFQTVSPYSLKDHIHVKTVVRVYRDTGACFQQLHGQVRWIDAAREDHGVVIFNQLLEECCECRC